ncbi:uncharacterized protein LOC133422002 [Cololabis saira]|uniref:uncharacterized protein LOC133422002 n=1 Tax=Cololabis saira TaxID=129043 RepID=UPI002AD2FB95|nr:uncharacterized protein LOC133422002 [Cololabis saira]
MSSFFVPRMNRGFVQILIFWFIPAVCDSAIITLETKPHVEATCGENVTLTCKASFSNQENVKIIKFQWLHAGRNMCANEDKDTDDLFRCGRTNTNSHHELTLILTKIKPIQEGQYLCKIHTSVGVENIKANVVTKDCIGNSTTSMNQTHATCSFRGNYPSGVVHWFQGDVNITDGVSTQAERDEDGFYDFQSTLDTEGRNLSQPLSCSLWMPSMGKYVVNLRSNALSSSGSIIQLQWVCVLLEIIMMSYRM